MKHLLKLPLCALAFAMTANTGFAQSSATGLKDAYKDYFSIGVAVNMQNITNPEQIAIIKKDFNSITAENDMKPQPTEPAYGQFNWENADKIANFCRSNGIKLRGHCLMWHAQIGKWMYQDEKGNLVSKEKLFQNMKHHITAIMERYKDVVYAWDVVNEAISDGGRPVMGQKPSPYRNSPLYQIAGDEFIKKAFIYAREADPNVLSQKFICSGSWDYEGGTIVCAGGAVHGEVDLVTAFTKSCNITFGKLAYQLGVERLRATAENFGFNENFKFGDFMIYNSVFPESVKNVGGLVWAGVGQGEVLATPQHMAMIAGAVANGGVMMKPVLVKRIENSMGVATHTMETSVYRQAMQPATAELLARAMYETVQSGTASRAAISGYTVCGKTGSAETSDDKSVPTNAWFVGFIRDESKPYAVAVVVEQGGAGSTVATPIARQALEKAIEVVG